MSPSPGTLLDKILKGLEQWSEPLLTIDSALPDAFCGTMHQVEKALGAQLVAGMRDEPVAEQDQCSRRSDLLQNTSMTTPRHQDHQLSFEQLCSAPAKAEELVEGDMHDETAALSFLRTSEHSADGTQTIDDKENQIARKCRGLDAHKPSTNEPTGRSGFSGRQGAARTAYAAHWIGGRRWSWRHRRPPWSVFQRPL